jgi:superfamily I DNA/RNA helicase
MSRPERTEQQLAAVADRERDVFLRAGAGTGKTTVLVDRFCAAALDPDGGIERILAFTFTERAADQLRRRVREELIERGREASGERLEALREAQGATDRAWISTIHGFCRRLLASHPAAAGLDPRFRVVDEAEADRLATRAFDAALEELVEGGAAGVRRSRRRQGTAEPGADRRRRRARPRRRCRRRAPRQAGRARDPLQGEAFRGQGLRALHAGAEAGALSRRGPGAPPRLRAAP